MASAPLLLPPYNCLTINFFVHASATTGSSEKCSATKRSTKVEKFSKDGSLAKCDTITKGSTAEIKITGIKHALFGSWDEIEREERQIRMELMLHQVIRFWVPSINCRVKNFQIYHFMCFRHVLAEFII